MKWTDILPTVLDVGSALLDANNARDRAKLQQRQSEAQRAANAAQATLAENNATIAGWQAADALYRGRVAVERSRAQTRVLRGAQVTGFAASGIALDSGSVAALLTDTDLTGEQDAQTQQFNAEREAWAFRMQALDYRNRAEILRNADVPVASSPDYAWLTSLAGSAARMYRDEERRK